MTEDGGHADLFHDETDGDLSIVLCTLNGRATIERQLAALTAQDTTVRFEIVVVDNGSTDGTPEVVAAARSDDARIRLVAAPDRHNLSYARNVGVAASRSRSVAFCDDDDLVGDGWVEAMAKALRTHPLVGSRLEYGALNADERMIGRARLQSEEIGEMFGLPLLSGAGFGCQRWLWERVGGKDETFGRTGEDFDFSMRVFEATGVRPVLADRAIYHYRLREGGRGTFRQTRRFGESHVQLYARHGRGRVDVRANTVDALRDWWWIMTRAPLAVLGTRRENWATHAGRRIGRLVGSVKYRSLWL